MKLEQWPLKPLSAICEIRPAKSEVKGEFESTDHVSFVPMKYLGIGQMTFDHSETREFGKLYPNYTYFADGDVLLAKITPCFENGKLGIAQNLVNGIGFGSSEYIVFRPNKDVCKEWIYYFLSQKRFRIEGERRMLGSVGQKRVSKDFIANYKIPVPPLEEQQRIVRILDELFANIDDSLAESQSRSHSAKELYESCTELAVNGKLVPQDPSEESGAQLLEQIIQQREYLWNLAEDEKMAVAPDRAKRGRYKQAKPTAKENLPEIPSNWTWASVEELSYFVVDYRGKTPPTSETGIPIISAANVREGFVDLSPPRFVSEETYNLWSVRGEPKAGDVLITTEAPVGRTAIYPENAKYLLTRRILGARLNERCNPEYIRLCLSAGFTARRIAWHSHGATVPRILKPDLFSVPIPFPPFEEQNRIMQQMRVVSQGVNSVEEKCMVKIASLDELKQSILQEAFSGKLTGGITA